MLFEFYPPGIVQVDEHGCIHQTNSAFADLLDYTNAELRGLSYWDIAYTALGERKTFIDRLNDAGRRISVVLHGMQVVSSTGEVQIWRIAEDITPRLRAEAAQRESEVKTVAPASNSRGRRIPI